MSGEPDPLGISRSAPREALEPPTDEDLEARAKAPDDSAHRRAFADPERRFGRYVLVSVLGQGSHGIVHRAWDPQLERPVAIKVLSRLDEQTRARFHREVKALARLRHPNVVPVFDAGELEGRPFFVMDLVAGKTLDAVCEEPLEPRAAARLIRSVAAGVAAAHEQGIIHRDLKPSNIIVTPSGEPVVVDFGLARLADAGPGLTASGVSHGTPAYAAPEQHEGRTAAIGPATDVYALGATLHHALTGEPPFEASSPAELTISVLRRPPEPPSRKNPAVPSALDAIVLRALAKDPASRHPSARELVEELDRFIASPDVADVVHPSAGKRIGPYEVVREVGFGGSATVYEARDFKGEKVALKVLRTRGGDAFQRFERERRLHERLGEEEGFVPILDAGATKDGGYIVMPFMTGGTLRDRLDAGPLPIADALSIGRALAAALTVAHGRGIVHRDLKPENVLFTARPEAKGAPDGVPLVSDLGLAKHFRKDVTGASESQSLSQTGAARGTPCYMAPEQFSDSKSIGPPADVYAWGAILYECLTGERLHEGENILQMLAAVDSGTHTPIPDLRADAPAPLVAIVERAIDKDPNVRFADGAALLAALRPERRARRSSRAVLAVAFGGALMGGLLVHALGAATAPRTQPPAVAPPAPPPPPDLSPAVELEIGRAADLSRAARALEASDPARALETWERVLDSTQATLDELLEARRRVRALHARVPPNTDPRKAGVWRARVLVFPRTVLWKPDGAGSWDCPLLPEDRKSIEASRASFERLVLELSRGWLRLELEVVESTDTVTELSGLGVGPFMPWSQILPADATRGIEAGKYDAVVAYVPMGPRQGGIPRLTSTMASDWFDRPGAACYGVLPIFERDDELVNQPGALELNMLVHMLRSSFEDAHGWPTGLFPRPDGYYEAYPECPDECWSRKGHVSPRLEFFRHVLCEHATPRMLRAATIRAHAANPWNGADLRAFRVKGTRVSFESPRRRFEVAQHVGKTFEGRKVPGLETWVTSAEEQDVRVLATSDKPGRILVNGVVVAQLAESVESGRFRLNEGTTSIVFECLEPTERWRISARLIAANGLPAPGVTVRGSPP